jgi:alkylation response protein AidB-like acyl-CoA dehydrogenase
VRSLAGRACSTRSEFGGQGLPKMVAAACMEMLQAANLSFALCPLLTDGAIEALLTAGSDVQKSICTCQRLHRWSAGLAR